MNKKDLTETDIRTKFITPALAGPSHTKWDVMNQVREEFYFTNGRVIVRGKTVRRGEAKKADYVLFYRPNFPIAVIEAKDNNYAVGAGMQQALEYAEILDIPFAYSSNGDAFLEHDRTATTGTVTRELALDQFPSPEELWGRYQASKGLSADQTAVATQKYHDSGKRDVFARYGEQARTVLAALLEKYADAGIKSVESLEILNVSPFTKIGTPIEIVNIFGGKPAYLRAIHELEDALYLEAA